MCSLNHLPEPGEVEDFELGIPGEAEELPPGDADRDEPTRVNDDDDEED